MKQKPGVMFFWETFETFKIISAEECKKLVLAIYDYSRNGVLPNFEDRALNLVWQTIQYRLDEDTRRYQDICNHRKDAGKKGAENRWQNEQNIASIANAIDDGKDSQHNSSHHISTTTSTNSDNVEQKHTRFVPPTLEEVKEYCFERGNSIDAERFVDYYTANGWVQGGGKKIKDWKACVRTWEQNDLNYSMKRDTTENPFSAFGGTLI